MELTATARALLMVSSMATAGGCTRMTAALTNPDAGGGSDGGASGDLGDVVPALDYPDVATLHDQAISRTCALNGGVCHNSREYPDFSTVTQLIDAIGKRCDVLAPTHADVHDPCEPEGDHLVVPSLGLDVEIARLEITPPTFGYGSDEISAITVDLAHDVAAPQLGAGDVEIHRGTHVFPLGAVEHIGVQAATAAGMTGRIALDLSAATGDGKRFLDDRRYPWDPSFIQVGDVNGNGTLGHTLGVSIVTPGAPLKSYAILRLIDASYGDLMPKQCRTWDDRATRALGCWIEGLKIGADGTPTNAYDPIDYAACTFKSVADGKGRCSTVDGAGVEAIFARNCGGSSCHVDAGGAPAAGLDLSMGKSYASLVGRASTERPQRTLVVAGDPDASYLSCKLEATCADRFGARMPASGGALSDFDLNAIRTWIQSGAPMP